MKKGAKYFYNSKQVLAQGLDDAKDYLRIKGFYIEQVSIFLDAYDYFIKHPSQYDGATLSQDLYDINGLELGSMLHDYLYKIGGYADKQSLREADAIHIKILRQCNKSGAEIKYRQARLFILREVLNYAWINRTFRGKTLSIQNRRLIYNIYINI